MYRYCSEAELNVNTVHNQNQWAYLYKHPNHEILQLMPNNKFKL